MVLDSTNLAIVQLFDSGNLIYHSELLDLNFLEYSFKKFGNQVRNVP